jgi:hypothetical protein
MPPSISFRKTNKQQDRMMAAESYKGFLELEQDFRKRFGIFAKVRPGFMSYSSTLTGVVMTPPMSFRYARSTDFALDVGGVVEYYWTRHALLRFEAEDSVLYNSPRPFTFNAARHLPASALSQELTPARDGVWISVLGTPSLRFIL